uniref:Uncharacterized protein n=1 Tax=Oryza sativa subsp. japonica TaxID=39947 RepID=Q7EZV2_ORYSJ|nr:hypothetical protein [Oryza sativa Japonica Group]
MPPSTSLEAFHCHSWSRRLVAPERRTTTPATTILEARSLGFRLAALAVAEQGNGEEYGATGELGFLDFFLFCFH